MSLIIEFKPISCHQIDGRINIEAMRESGMVGFWKRKNIFVFLLMAFINLYLI